MVRKIDALIEYTKIFFNFIFSLFKKIKSYIPCFFLILLLLFSLSAAYSHFFDSIEEEGALFFCAFPETYCGEKEFCQIDFIVRLNYATKSYFYQDKDINIKIDVQFIPKSFKKDREINIFFENAVLSQETATLVGEDFQIYKDLDIPPLPRIKFNTNDVNSVKYIFSENLILKAIDSGVLSPKILVSDKEANCIIKNKPPVVLTRTDEIQIQSNQIVSFFTVVVVILMILQIFLPFILPKRS